MHLRRFALACVLATGLVAAGLLAAGAGPALAAPAAVHPGQQAAEVEAGIRVDLIPGAKFCTPEFRVRQSLLLQVGVFPNLGNPRATITVRLNGTKIFKKKGTGPQAVGASFTQPGIYQVCAHYQLREAVAPGDPADHMNVEIVAFGS